MWVFHLMLYVLSCLSKIAMLLSSRSMNVKLQMLFRTPTIRVYIAEKFHHLLDVINELLNFVALKIFFF
jgi:hypothetical protein